MVLKRFRLGLMMIVLPVMFVGCLKKAEPPVLTNPDIPAGSKKMDDSKGDASGGSTPKPPEG
jgi:hypothetical protein